jgi:hypothetical protein
MKVSQINCISKGPKFVQDLPDIYKINHSLARKWTPQLRFSAGATGMFLFSSPYAERQQFCHLFYMGVKRGFFL